MSSARCFFFQRYFQEFQKKFLKKFSKAFLQDSAQFPSHNVENFILKFHQRSYQCFFFSVIPSRDSCREFSRGFSGYSKNSFSDSFKISDLFFASMRFQIFVRGLFQEFRCIKSSRSFSRIRSGLFSENS